MFVLLCLPAVSGLCQIGSVVPPLPVLTLPDAVNDALANNRMLNAGALDIQKADWAAAAARTGALPTLTLNATGGVLLNPVDIRVPAGSLGTVSGTPFPDHDARIYSANSGVGFVGATLIQPITQLPAIELNARLQEIGAQIAMQEQRERRSTLVEGVQLCYFAILENEDNLASAEEMAKYDQELERTVADFVAKRTALQSDLLDVQAQGAQQELKITQLQDSVADGREKLNVLMGRDVDAPFEVTTPEETAPALDDLSALRAQALAQRSDVQVAALRLNEAQTGLRLALSSNGPSVSAILSYNQLADSAKINGIPNQFSYAGLQLDWKPIDWGRSGYSAREQSIAVQQAAAALEDSRTSAVLQVDSAARAYREAVQQNVVAQAGEAAAEERLREMTNQYAVKAILLKELMQQQATAAEAADHKELATLQMLSARTGLDQALGANE